MGIQNIGEDILLITLTEQPQNGHELDVVNKMFGDVVDRDVVVDLAKVEVLTSGAICGLMILERLLRAAGRQLVLFNVPPAIKQVFVRTDLLTVFEFAGTEVEALQQVQSRRSSWAGT